MGRKSPLLNKNRPFSISLKGLFCFFMLNNICALVLRFIVLRCDKLNVVGIDNCLLKLRSEVCIDGVHDIAVGSVRVLSRGHNNEISVPCINDLHVVKREAVVESYGYDGLHRTLVEKFSDFDVGDLHRCTSFLGVIVFCFAEYIIQ